MYSSALRKLRIKKLMTKHDNAIYDEVSQCETGTHRGEEYHNTGHSDVSSAVTYQKKKVKCVNFHPFLKLQKVIY